MRIAVVGPTGFGGGQNATHAILRFLQSHNYDVVFFDDRIDSPPPRWWRGYHRLRRMLFREGPARDVIQNQIADTIRAGGFTTVIGVQAGDVLLRDLPCRKIFFCRAPAAHELYFKLAQWTLDPSDRIRAVETSRRRELEVFRSSDHVTIAWKTYEDYIRRYVYDGPNIVSHPRGGWTGCYPRRERASFNGPPALVYLGGLGKYYNNMELLARLSSSLPYSLDVYGSRPPGKGHSLRYAGPMQDTDSQLTKYQFGINTVSRELLRRQGFSSKIFMYLSYGLPCLFAEWEEFPHELGGCVPYNEANIEGVIERFSERRAWEELSDQAYAQSQELSWDKVLEPLLDLLA
ncbi:MAG: hypothetical protein HY675_05385 [Chloroflexi bacterium]|nr:hypothetical protein [Chloroflexota bacterium]